MTEAISAHPGHYDAQALVTAIGNYDPTGARSMLDAMSVDELKSVSFYLAETFSMSSPLSHPDNVHRHILGQRANEVDIAIDSFLESLDKPAQDAARATILGDTSLLIGCAALLIDGIVAAHNSLTERATELRKLAADAEEG